MKPPALAPLIANRAGSASRCAPIDTAPAMQSCTSTTPPAALQPVSVRTAETGAAAVVDIENGKAARRPELVRDLEIGCSEAGRPTMGQRDQGWQAVGGCAAAGVDRGG